MRIVRKRRVVCQKVMIGGGSVAMSRGVTPRDYRRWVQMVFQDSYASRNPRLSLQDTIAFGPRPTGGVASRRHAPRPRHAAAGWPCARGVRQQVAARIVRRSSPARDDCARAVGFDEAGLPTSCQIVGRYFDEASVLRVGRVYERARAWSSRRPEL